MSEILVRATSPEGKSRDRLFRTYNTTDEYGSPIVRTALSQAEDYRASCLSDGSSVEVVS